MRTKVLVLTAVLALAGASCDAASDDDQIEAEPTSELAEGEFTLTGLTVDALEGADPGSGFPEEVGVDDEDEVGGIAVRAEEDLDAVGLDDCDTVQDAYVVYYTPDTEFEPASLANDDGFPENLEGQNVSVRGEVHEPAETDDDADTIASPEGSSDNIPDDCVIVAEEVEVVEDTTDPAATGGGGTGGGTTGGGSPTPDADGTPGPTGSPGEFPDVGIFDPEDPPSPAPCEGQKACRDEPGIGQPGGSV